jgi:hypothetical protein
MILDESCQDVGCLPRERFPVHIFYTLIAKFQIGNPGLDLLREVPREWETRFSHTVICDSRGQVRAKICICLLFRFVPGLIHIFPQVMHLHATNHYFVTFLTESAGGTGCTM